jgi:energy-coupling factor transporter ATP-binding protein EcfA2
VPEHFDLETFRTRHFDYQPGHHVAAFGPTQISGKSTLMLALLEAVKRYQPEIGATVLVMKHRDRVVAHWTKRLGFREIPGWPPEPKFSELPPFGRKPAGYTLWPRQSLTNPVADNEHLQRQFTAAMVHNRGHVPSITFADEIYGLVAELSKVKDRAGEPMVPMRSLLTAVTTRDSGADHGLWYASQKPSGTQGISLPGFLFNSAEHMFLAKDGEERNRQRYGEIACGIDPGSIERETLKLDKNSWLYIRRSGPEWAIVDAYDPSLAV